MVIKFNLFTSQQLSNWVSESCRAKLEQCVLDWFILPLEGPHLKDHAANYVLSGHRGISERAVKSEHQDLWILF